MARPKKEIADPSETSEQISERKLRQLIKDKRTAYKDMREIAGGIGAKVRSAVEHDNLDTWAFNICTRLDRMENEKIAAKLDALDYYLDATGMRERAASAPRMPMGDNIEEFPGNEAAE